MVTGTSRTGRSSVVAGAVLLALGLAGIAGERMRPFGTADGALRRCIVAAGSGSLDDVLSLDRCGPIRDSAVVLAERRGQEEFRRIVGLYEAAARAGRQRFDVVVQSIVARGEAAFQALPYREQQAVREASTNEWVLAEGFASLDSSRRAILGEPAVLSAAAVPDEVVAALGEALMDEELRGRVRGRSDAELAADPENAHLARVRRSAGQTALAEARRQAERTGVARFRSLDHSTRRRIADRSRNDFVIDHGMRQMTEAERAAVPSRDMALRAWTGLPMEGLADHLATLGRGLLPPEVQQDLPPESLAEFRAGEEEFVRREGRRLAEAELREAVAGSVLAVESRPPPVGTTLFRRSTASLTVEWSGLGAAQARGLLGSSFQARFEPAGWRVLR